MHIMITGAAGFIGSQLAHTLWKRGAKLLLLDNFSYGKEDNLKFDDHDFTDEVIRLDIRDRKALVSVCEGKDIDFI